MILTGGLGTRAREISFDSPKSMIKIESKPFIDYQLELLNKHGLDEILLCVGHQGDKIIKYVGDGSRFGMNVKYSKEDPRNLLGTGGAILNAFDYLHSNFMVIYGDSYLDINYDDVKEKYYRSGSYSLMVIYNNRNKYDTSNVEFDGERILKYSKKERTSRMQFIDYGINIYCKKTFSDYRGSETFDLLEIQEALVENGLVEAYETKKRFYHIGNKVSFNEFERMIKEKNDNN